MAKADAVFIYIGTYQDEAAARDDDLMGAHADERA
jgi:hypothetical protein